MRRGKETATPASAGVVISPCREGTVAVGFTSGRGGLAFLQGLVLPNGHSPSVAIWFRPEAANAGCPGKSAERGVAESHVSLARGPRSSQQLCCQCEDTGGRTRLVRGGPSVADTGSAGGHVVDCQTGSARSPRGRPQRLAVWERTDSCGFGRGSSIAYQAERTSEGFGCRVPTGLRKEPRKRSVTELPACCDGASALARPRMTIRGRHWVDGGCVVARQADFARSPRGRSHRPRGLDSEEKAPASVGAGQSRFRSRGDSAVRGYQKGVHG